MPPALQLIGKRFGKLTILARAPSDSGKARWQALCDCGQTTFAASGDLRNGRYVSCGCAKVSHGKFKGVARGTNIDGTYRCWTAMIQRCENPNCPAYSDYGGRGISVCTRWRSAYMDFLADMGSRPAGLSLDRYPDPNGNYEPGNVRWATNLEQNRNRRSSRLTYDLAQELLGRLEHGESQIAVAKRLGISFQHVSELWRGGEWPDLERPWLVDGRTPRFNRRK